MSNQDRDELLSAYIDRELTQIQSDEIESLCSTDAFLADQVTEIRELDRALRSVLEPPSLDLSALMEKLESPDRIHLPNPTQWTRFHFGSLLGAAACILIALGLLLYSRSGLNRNLDSSGRSIVKVAQVVGQVETRKNAQSDWIVLRADTQLAIDKGVSIRTGEKSYCELESPNGTTIRLSQGTETRFNKPNLVDLLRGKVWCRTANEDFAVRANFDRESQNAAPSELTFSCPAKSIGQWEMEPGSVRCFGVADNETRVMLADHESLLIAPGEWLKLSWTGEAIERGLFDRLQESMWQLPLLAARSAKDAELQATVRQLLAHFGRSKMQILFDEQIRELGPAGTIPLIYFVRSNDSASEPSLRRYAMQIVADLAPEAARDDLMILTQDSDSEVAQSAKRTLQRLDQRRP